MKLRITHEVFEDSPQATKRSRTGNIVRFAVGLLPTLFALVILVYSFVLPVQVGGSRALPEELWKLALYQLPTMAVMYLLYILWPNLLRRSCRLLMLKEVFFPEEEQEDPEEQGEKLSRRERRAAAKAHKEEYRGRKRSLKTRFGTRLLGQSLRYGLTGICLVLALDGGSLFAHGLTGEKFRFLHAGGLIWAVVALGGWIWAMVALRKLGTQKPEEEFPELPDREVSEV